MQGVPGELAAVLWGMRAMPHRWACQVRVLGLAGDVPGLRCFGGRFTKTPSGVNLPVQEDGSPLASEAGVCLEAALQSLLNIHPLRVRAPIYPFW